MVANEEEQLSIKTLLSFFIPLGVSASLVTFSHIIINSTLARAENSELVIASYAIAMSFFAITERIGVLLRQSCTTLVRDKRSAKLMAGFSFYLIGSLLLVSSAVAYTPIGSYIFGGIFGVKATLVADVKDSYQVLIYVTIFSAFRCLCQGIIIYNRQTKWLTIGMVIRLIAMYFLSFAFIKSGSIDGTTGPVIFLIGMIIECIVSMIEAWSLYKKMPVKVKREEVKSKSEILRFFSPLMLSALFTVIIGPVINIFLGKTENIETAIASFAIAFSVTQLIISFFSYMHQIVINFYGQYETKVKKFAFIIGGIPFMIMATLGFTPIGSFIMDHWMGINGKLLDASLYTLRGFSIFALVFPFVDFLNGVLMLQKQTKVTIFSQATNLVITFIVLLIGIRLSTEWNGVLGAMAMSLGLLGELLVIYLILQKPQHFGISNKGPLKKYKNTVKRGV